MKARNVFIAIVVALSLIIGYIPTFSFAVTEEDFDGNDSLDFKVDPPKSTTVYFDFDDEDEIIEVNGPSDYWIEFTVYDDGKYLSYTTHNVQIDELSVKGGNAYRLYSGLGSSGVEFRAPDNDGGNIPQISHYSFNVTLVPPPPPPDPLGEIDVTKIVKDKDGKVISDNTRFEFELYMWVDDGWDEVDDESPFYINGNGIKTIDGLSLGKYKVVEVDIPDGYELDSDNEIEVILNKDILERKAEFTNIKDDDTPPPPPDDKGSLIVHKRILRHTGSVDANLGDDEFTIRLSGPLPVDGDLYEVRVLTINYDGNGDNVAFNDLPFGDYILEETHINGEAIDSSDYHIQLPGNNGEIVGSDIKIESKGTENRWLVNHDHTPPPPKLGEIEVEKFVVDEDDDVLYYDETEFKFRLFMWVEGNWEEVEEESPFYIIGNNTKKIENLPQGKYKVVEVEIPAGFELDSDNHVEVILSENDMTGEADFTNKLLEEPPWRGTIRVRKLMRENPNASLAGFQFELRENGVKVAGPATTDTFGEAEFNNLPAGTYTLVELTTGYIAEYLDDNPVTIGPEMENENDNVWIVRVNNREIPPPPVRGSVEVEKIVQTRLGNPLNSNTRFYFELHRRVEGSWVLVDEGSILGNGTLVFDDLVDGEYRIREVDIDDDFDLFTSNNLIVEIEDGSDEDVEFINRRVPPPPDDDDDDPPPPDDDDENPPPPEEEEETPNEEVPQAPPPPPPVVETPPAVLEEVEVVEEPVPEAVLPKTGTADPLAISGFGGLLLGLGLLLKKKEE